MKKTLTIFTVLWLFVLLFSCEEEQIDNVVPTLKGCKDLTIHIRQGTDDLLKEGIKAIDDVDGDITDRIQITHSVAWNKEGIYEVMYAVTDMAGNQQTAKIKVTIVSENPILSFESSQDTIQVKLDEKVNLLEGVKAIDAEDGDITPNIKVYNKDNILISNCKEYVFETGGSYTFKYSVMDTEKNNVEKTLIFTAVYDWGKAAVVPNFQIPQEYVEHIGKNWDKWGWGKTYSFFNKIAHTPKDYKELLSKLKLFEAQAMSVAYVKYGRRDMSLEEYRKYLKDWYIIIDESIDEHQLNAKEFQGVFDETLSGPLAKPVTNPELSNHGHGVDIVLPNIIRNRKAISGEAKGLCTDMILAGANKAIISTGQKYDSWEEINSQNFQITPDKKCILSQSFSGWNNGVYSSFEWNNMIHRENYDTDYDTVRSLNDLRREFDFWKEFLQNRNIIVCNSAGNVGTNKKNYDPHPNYRYRFIRRITQPGDEISYYKPYEVKDDTITFSCDVSYFPNGIKDKLILPVGAIQYFDGNWESHIYNVISNGETFYGISGFQNLWRDGGVTGTSASAPFLAGTLYLAATKNPKLTCEELTDKARAYSETDIKLYYTEKVAPALIGEIGSHRNNSSIQTHKFDHSAKGYCFKVGEYMEAEMTEPMLSPVSLKSKEKVVLDLGNYPLIYAYGLGVVNDKGENAATLQIEDVKGSYYIDTKVLKKAGKKAGDKIKIQITYLVEDVDNNDSLVAFKTLFEEIELTE